MTSTQTNERTKLLSVGGRTIKESRIRELIREELIYSQILDALNEAARRRGATEQIFAKVDEKHPLGSYKRLESMVRAGKSSWMTYGDEKTIPIGSQSGTGRLYMNPELPDDQQMYVAFNPEFTTTWVVYKVLPSKVARDHVLELFSPTKVF